MQDHAVGAGYPQCHDDGDQHGQCQQCDGAARDVVAVERGHRLGVHQLLPYPESGEEGRRVALHTRAVEERLDVGSVAGGDE
ncbi:hypothetical protein NTPn18_10770 [Streptococcus pneumoniae]|nr:hypothetical protein NTPn18_10770 [Streptococcus pneumoniae]